MALFHDTIHTVNARDYDQRQVDAWAPSDPDPWRWADTLARRDTLVAEEDGTIVGFGELEDDGHINRFYCHKDHQGRGVGTLLLNALEVAARHKGLERLFTEASITARPFFARKGFQLLRQQTVTVRDVAFVNFQMEKVLETGPRPDQFS
jgi:N-acetylglutamate synthase-like GNAT family acetyltransferase